MPRKSPEEPPPELDGTLTAGDLAFELQQLQFEHGRVFHAVKLDEDVRDFLVTQLIRQATRRT